MKQQWRRSALGREARTSDPSWLVVEEGFNLAREHEIESIFAVGNGYLGIRASLEEGSQLSSAATFAAGVYVDYLTSGGPKLAVLPEWPHLEISIDGDQLSMSSGEVLEHR
jgi:trehalose/maltose hydrolase-like predicted phosphorylase